MTSATKVLRRMLDERGVEWWSEDDKEEPAYYFVTKWFANAQEQTYEEIPAIRGRSLKAFCVSPEQAVAATLGPGTCKVESSVAIEFDTLISPDFFEFEMGCGYRFRWSDNEPPDHCPGCGRKVVHGGS